MSPAVVAVAARPVKVTEAFKAELRRVKPFTLDDALKDYASLVERMSDEQLAREFARVEALPGSECRHVLDEAFEARQAARHEQQSRAFADLIAAIAPTTRWGWAS